MEHDADVSHHNIRMKAKISFNTFWNLLKHFYDTFTKGIYSLSLSIASIG